MASLDEELLMDEQENRREIAYIRERLPLDVKDKYTDEQMLWMLDTIVDYYVTSGILESTDDEVDIDLEQVADHLCRQAKDDGIGTLDPQEMFFVAQADIDFQEDSL